MADSDVQVVRVKNRLDPQYISVASAGYRDFGLNLLIQTEETGRLGLDRHVCEVQLLLLPFAEIKVHHLQPFHVFRLEPCLIDDIQICTQMISLFDYKYHHHITRQILSAQFFCLTSVLLASGLTSHKIKEHKSAIHFLITLPLNNAKLACA